VFRNLEMSIAPALSLDQLEVLLTVVETGGFAAAGRTLNRATSAISYAIDTLERQLGILLFDRGTTRRPRLTLAGQAVIEEARAVMMRADMLRARVKAIAEGLEPELSIVVDYLMPTEQLAEAFRAFHAEFPGVPLHLHGETSDGVERLIRSGQFKIGIGSFLHMRRDGLTCIQLSGVPIIPVARADHPLALASTRSGTGRDHLQIILADMVETDRFSPGVVAGSIWRVGDLTAKRALLLAGVGWGGMPEPMVRADIQAGRLLRLNLTDYRGGLYHLQIAYKNDTPLGPACSWLVDQLTGQSQRRHAGADPAPGSAVAARPADDDRIDGTRKRRRG
jgi:DNA-binding transcriptional LysR family regulator